MFFFFSLFCMLLGFRFRDRIRIGFHNDYVDGCTAAVVEGEDGAFVDVCSGDDDPDQTHEADGVV